MKIYELYEKYQLHIDQFFFLLFCLQAKNYLKKLIECY